MEKRNQAQQKIPEDFYLSYKNSELYANDYLAFYNKNWLTSNSIKFFYEDLKQTYPEPDYLIFDPFQSQILIDVYSDFECLVDWFQEQFQKAKYIFLPVNDEDSNNIPGGGTHWALLVYEQASKKFIYYDSNRSYIDNSFKIAQKVLGIIQNKQQKYKQEDIMIINKNTPQQQNSFDCGMFTISITEALLYIISEKQLQLKDLDSELNQIVTQSIVTEKRRKIQQFVKDIIKKQQSEKQ